MIRGMMMSPPSKCLVALFFFAALGHLIVVTSCSVTSVLSSEPKGEHHLSKKVQCSTAAGSNKASMQQQQQSGAKWSSSGVGPIVLVTGSNRGLGLGLVRELAKRSEVKAIFAGCREPDKAEALKQLQHEHPNLIRPLALDVASNKSIRAAFQEVSRALEAMNDDDNDEQIKGLNLLINNAGILELEGGSPLKPNRQSYLRHFDVNTVGAVMTSMEFLPLLRRASSVGQPARILSISSRMGSTAHVPTYHIHPAHNIAYGMSKAALNHFTKALASEVQGLVAVAMCPGWVRTDMGSSSASLSAEESASTILQLVAELGPERSGAFINSRTGEDFPY